VNNNLKPENGFNAEGGINFIFDKWFSLNANMYYLRLQDEIAYNGIHNENMDETSRLGTNINATIMPFEFLELQGNYSYVNAEFASGKNTGNIIPMVSAHEVSGSARFALPLNIKLSVNLDYRSDFYQAGDYANTLSKTDDYFLLGTSLSYTLDKNNQHLMLLFQCENILNTKYAPLVYYGSYYPANGREFNLSVQYRF
jgi:iron complex outermembrane receptor protein